MDTDKVTRAFDRMRRELRLILSEKTGGAVTDLGGCDRDGSGSPVRDSSDMCPDGGRQVFCFIDLESWPAYRGQRVCPVGAAACCPEHLTDAEWAAVLLRFKAEYPPPV